MTRNTVVLIEDEPDQARLLRMHLEKKFGTSVELLPGDGRSSYPSMEDFMRSPQQPKSPKVIIADLFLSKGIVTPPIAFHQLMYNFFPSPVDFELLCGRLGVLKKLRQCYPDANIQVFTYFPTYFEELNEPFSPDPYLFSDYSSGKLLKHLKDKKNEGGFNTFKQQKGIGGRPLGDTTGLYLLQCKAMKDAIYERLQGILYCTPSDDHVSLLPDSLFTKTANIEIDIRKLVDRISDLLALKE